MTLTEILADVASHIGMSISTNTRITTTEATAWINQAYRTTCSALAKVNVNYFNGEEIEADTTDGTASYTLPTDFLVMKRVEIRWDDGEDRIRVTPIDINQLQGTTTPDAETFSQENPYYYLWENKIYFLPVPDETSSTWTTNPGAAYKLWYYEMPADLSGSNTPVTPAAYHHIFAYFAAAQACVGKLDNPQKADRLEAKWQNGMFRLISENTLKDQNKPMSFRIVRGRTTETGIWRP